MKYTTQIQIDKPIDTCFALIENIDHLKHWQSGLHSVEHISGTPRQVGAILQLNYLFDRQYLTLTETLTFKEKNKALHFNFDTKGIHNIQENYFEATDSNTTIWTCNNEFIPTSLSTRLMLLLIPRTFKKQTKKYLADFKNYAEQGISVKED